MEVRKRWLIDILEQHGSCAKIAYLDGRPVAQIVFCPEESMPYIHDPRQDVVNLLCIYSPFPEAQRKGAATALVKDLVGECFSGLSCLSGRPCHFVVTSPFPIEGKISLPRFYEKCGFRQGHKEMYLEMEGKYITRDFPEYRTLTGDLDRTIILYTPACEWGYFYAFKIREIIREMDPDHLVEIFNIWDSPEDYMKRPLQKVTAGRTIIKGQIISGGIFWIDREAFHREVEEAFARANHIILK